jgi:hypothetical protein
LDSHHFLAKLSAPKLHELLGDGSLQMAIEIGMIWVNAMVQPVALFSRALEMMVRLWEIIPFYGPTIQVNVKYDNLPRFMVDEWWLYHDV